eukprot:Platyproteum_vivax@DN2638_c0_g1_i1.p1
MTLYHIVRSLEKVTENLSHLNVLDDSSDKTIAHIKADQREILYTIRGTLRSLSSQVDSHVEEFCELQQLLLNEAVRASYQSCAEEQNKTQKELQSSIETTMTEAMNDIADAATPISEFSRLDAKRLIDQIMNTYSQNTEAARLQALRDFFSRDHSRTSDLLAYVHRRMEQCMNKHFLAVRESMDVMQDTIKNREVPRIDSSSSAELTEGSHLEHLYNKMCELGASIEEARQLILTSPVDDPQQIKADLWTYLTKVQHHVESVAEEGKLRYSKMVTVKDKAKPYENDKHDSGSSTSVSEAPAASKSFDEQLSNFNATDTTCESQQNLAASSIQKNVRKWLKNKWSVVPEAGKAPVLAKKPSTGNSPVATKTSGSEEKSDSDRRSEAESLSALPPGDRKSGDKRDGRHGDGRHGDGMPDRKEVDDEKREHYNRVKDEPEEKSKKMMAAADLPIAAH